MSIVRFPEHAREDKLNPLIFERVEIGVSPVSTRKDIPYFYLFLSKSLLYPPHARKRIRVSIISTAITQKRVIDRARCTLCARKRLYSTFGRKYGRQTGVSPAHTGTALRKIKGGTETEPPGSFPHFRGNKGYS